VGRKDGGHHLCRGMAFSMRPMKMPATRLKVSAVSEQEDEEAPQKVFLFCRRVGYSRHTIVFTSTAKILSLKMIVFFYT
jgi:hypothetical protein